MSSIRILDIPEEGRKKLMPIFNNVFEEINQKDTPTIDFRVKDNHYFLLLGEKKRDLSNK